MISEGAVASWLGQVQAGNPVAIQQLWERYFPRLVELARSKLRGALCRAADEEDVALSALDSFCRHAEQGRFPHLADGDSLWRLLSVITARQACQLCRNERRRKRGGAAGPGIGHGDGFHLDQVLGREPSPDFAAQTAEECRRLLHALQDRELEAIDVWRLEGFSVEEIAAKLGYAPR
jgi:DNA-directed RNA polymerase specialized sigma24 family protein